MFQCVWVADFVNLTLYSSQNVCVCANRDIWLRGKCQKTKPKYKQCSWHKSRTKRDTSLWLPVALLLLYPQPDKIGCFPKLVQIMLAGKANGEQKLKDSFFCCTCCLNGPTTQCYKYSCSLLIHHKWLFKLWNVGLEQKEEKKLLWMLLIFLWWCSDVRVEHQSSERYSGKTQTETILNLLLQTPLHPPLSMITTCSLISRQAIRTKIAKTIFFFLLTWLWRFQLWNIIYAVFSSLFFSSLCYLLQRPTQFSYSLSNPSDMLPNALTPLQVLPNLFWQLRQELAPIVPIICKILQCLGIGSGWAEKMSRIA